MTQAKPNSPILSSRAAPCAALHTTVEALAPSGEETECATHIIMAIVENRAKEVGLAILDTSKLTLGILQFIETSRSYTITKSVIEQFGAPSKLVIVDSAKSEVRLGVNYYTRCYPQVPMERGFFDDTQAYSLLQTMTSGDSISSSEAAAEEIASTKYLALSAAGALLHFIGSQHMGMRVVPGSIGILDLQLLNYMQLDRQTTAALEIVRSQRPPPGGNMKHACLSGTLFQILNKTRTACGARLLKASLLQPLIDAGTIQERLNAVEELSGYKEPRNSDSCAAIGGDTEQIHAMSFGLAVWLKNSLPRDLDQTCRGLGLMSGSNTKSSTSLAQQLTKLVHSVLSLKKLLAVLPSLVEILQPATVKLLAVIRENMQAPVFSEILSAIHECVDEDAEALRNPFMSQIQCVFAVKPQVDQFLDLSRSTFSSVTQRIQALVDDYRAATGIQGIKSNYSARRGFGIIIPKGKRKKDEHSQRGGGGDGVNIPEYFQILETKTSYWLCSTQELNALNSRLREATMDCLRLSEQALETLRAEILQRLPQIRKLIDNIALLDMLLAFAEAAVYSRGLGQPYCKPKVFSSKAAPLAIIGGRHPILEKKMINDVDYHPNDTYLCHTNNLSIVMGPNMSGKSTYLRQVGLIVIMAQAGSFVPASFMSFSPFHSIGTHAVSTAASAAQDTSSFLAEMMQTAQIFRQHLPRALVLVDELGRSTSSADGLALSVAVAEQLLASGAKSIFTTHFPAMAELAIVQSRCKIWNFGVTVDDDGIEYTRKLEPGVVRLEKYGIELAKTCGFPDEVIQSASQIYDLLVDDSKATGSHNGTSSSTKPAANNLGLKFTSLKDSTTCFADPPLQQHTTPLFPSEPHSALPYMGQNQLTTALRNVGNQRRLLRLQHKLMCVALRATSSENTSADEVRRQLAPLKAEAAALLATRFAVPITSVSDPVRKGVNGGDTTRSFHTS